MRYQPLTPFSPNFSTEERPIQASEENEMHLVEGELIEEVEKLDEGWWSGVGDNGAKRGLFPGESERGVRCDWFNVFPTSKLRGRN